MSQLLSKNLLINKFSLNQLNSLLFSQLKSKSIIKSPLNILGNQNYSLLAKKKIENDKKIYENGKVSNLSRTKISQLLLPNQANEQGYVYGGQVLSWIDVCAGITAKRHSAYRCVTASVDSVHFLHPIRVGDAAILEATVNRTWNTSMEVGVTVISENLLSGEKRPCCQAYLTFVGIENGKPTKVPKLIPISEEEKIEFEKADKRKASRLASVKPSITREKAREKLNNYSKSSTSSWPGSIASSYSEVVEIIMPNHINPYGATFGGQIMKWMENCALTSAYRYARTHLITASMDAIHFLLPIQNGDLLIIRSFVSSVFNSSLEVFVTVEVENHVTGERVFANDGFITFVALESKNTGKPSPVQRPLNGNFSFSNGMERKKHRLEERSQLQQYFKNKYRK